MTILYNGVDLVEIKRFEDLNPRILTRFTNRVYTSFEIEICEGNVRCLAGRFAAKEAVSKALGTGIGKIRWQEIEILRGESGQPLLHLHGRAQEIAQAKGITGWALSISHGKEIAIAFVVAIGI
ncbi:MAG: holo-[acyl-carrier-protein] synthase [Chloroflexi bacterium 44-23]|nr:MAG: holo-[acyl-carrier-protein] synthase [Chloroflexi bacterium 44-23]